MRARAPHRRSRSDPGRDANRKEPRWTAWDPAASSVAATRPTGASARRSARSGGRAHDATLGRHVEIICLAGRRSAQRRAARRSASRGGRRLAPNLVRILDVGRDESLAFVVEEDLTDCHSAHRLVAIGRPARRRGAPDHRRGRDRARRRRPARAAPSRPDPGRRPAHPRGRGQGPRRRHDRGHAPEPTTSRLRRRARRDAVGVVAVAYAGLTGLWPRLGELETVGCGSPPRRRRLGRPLRARLRVSPVTSTPCVGSPSTRTRARSRPGTTPGRSPRGRRPRRLPARTPPTGESMTLHVGACGTAAPADIVEQDRTVVLPARRPPRGLVGQRRVRRGHRLRSGPGRRGTPERRPRPGSHAPAARSVGAAAGGAGAAAGAGGPRGEVRQPRSRRGGGPGRRGNRAARDGQGHRTDSARPPDTFGQRAATLGTGHDDEIPRPDDARPSRSTGTSPGSPSSSSRLRRSRRSSSASGASRRSAPGSSLDLSGGRAPVASAPRRRRRPATSTDSRGSAAAGAHSRSSAPTVSTRSGTDTRTTPRPPASSTATRRRRGRPSATTPPNSAG